MYGDDHRVKAKHSRTRSKGKTRKLSSELHYIIYDIHYYLVPSYPLTRGGGGGGACYDIIMYCYYDYYYTSAVIVLL